jgi:hypothetical protein
MVRRRVSPPSDDGDGEDVFITKRDRYLISFWESKAARNGR